MSNGPMCCYIRACCPESEQRKLLAKKIADNWQEDPNVGIVSAERDAPGLAQSTADMILDNFDLVPKGVGVAIAEGYKPLFKEQLR